MAIHAFSRALLEQIRTSCAGFERSAADSAQTLKRAAVGIVLVDMDDGSGEAGFLLTLRAASLRAHGGQFALPGGRVDEGESVIETVIRECAEELGLMLSPDHVLGVLDDYPTRSGYAVTPVVMAVTAGQAMVPNPDEVAAVFRIALRQITRDGAVEFVTIAESDRPVVRLDIGEDKIHAPTAAMLFQFAELLAGRTTRVAGYDQPVFAWR